MPTDYNDYSQYADDSQKEIIKALKTQTQAQAAKFLGISKRTLERKLRKLKEKAASKGYAPDYGLDKPAPDGFNVSTLRVNSSGQYVPAYAKVAKDKQSYKELVDYLVEASKSFKKPKITKAPKNVDDDLLNLYTITDLHIGLLCDADESGEDWDIRIAEELVNDCLSDMIDRSPGAKTCIINQLGDFLHTDSLTPVTPASGNVVDCDTRYPKMALKAFCILKNMVELCLQKHEKVIVYNLPGNHDESSAPWLQICMEGMFGENPRVEVVQDPKVYQHYVFGSTFLGFHHGHKSKMANLINIFNSDPFFRSDWGSCKYSYIHSGHLHHLKVLEDNGAITTQHPCLSARSAYESRGGWASNRACMAITYHKEFGEYSCVYSRPEMFTES